MTNTRWVVILLILVMSLSSCTNSDTIIGMPLADSAEIDMATRMSVSDISEEPVSKLDDLDPAQPLQPIEEYIEPVAPKIQSFSSPRRKLQVTRAKIHSEIEQIVTEEPEKTISVVIDLSSDVDKKQIVDAIIQAGGVVTDEFEIGDIIVAEVNSTIVELLADEDVLEIAPEQEYTIFLDDVVDSEGISSVWEQNITGSGVRIAILDTGVDPTHEMFLNSDVVSSSFVEESAVDGNGHGSHVAGIALGDGSVKGVAPGATLLSAKVLTDRGIGKTSSIIAGINWAVENDADVISMSFGSTTADYDGPLASAIREAISHGVVFISASGNCRLGCGGFYGVTMPGSMEEVITVGAVDDVHEIAPFSSGEVFEDYVKPDVVSVGVDILSADIKDVSGKGYKSASGTSMSAPFVAGTVALLLENEDLDHWQVKDRLVASSVDIGVDGVDDEYGAGVVNNSLLFSLQLIETNKTETNHSSPLENITEIIEHLPDPDDIPKSRNGTFVIVPVNKLAVIQSMPEEVEIMSIDEPSSEPSMIDDGTPDAVRIMMPNIAPFVPPNISEEQLIQSIEEEFTTTGTGYIDYYDTYDYRSSRYDDIVWGGEDMDVKLKGYESDTMTICYDWCDDGTWDHCFADSPSDLDDCFDESSTVRQVCSNGQCYGAAMDEWHPIDTSYSGDKWKCSVDARYYRGCGTSNYQYEDVGADAYYVISPRQNDCNSHGGSYDDRGKFSSSTWVRINSDLTCSSDSGCDNSKDDSLSDFGSYGDSSPDDVCSLKDTYSDCDSDNECLSGHCSCVGTGCDTWDFQSDYCCPAGQEWLGNRCGQTCTEGYTGNKRCSSDTVQEEYQNYDCSIEWHNDVTCSSTQKCSGGQCVVKTCNDFSGTYGSCSSDGSNRRSGNMVQVCDDQIWGFGQKLCWEKESSLGESSFCSDLTSFGQKCGHGEYDCDSDSECSTSHCSGIFDAGCCNVGEDWDTSTHTCKIADGSTCSFNNQCLSGNCVHSVCSVTPYIVGDNYCDSGETCSNSPNDCGRCDGESCTSNSLCANGYCVHGSCYDQPTKQGDGHCDTGENPSNSPSDCQGDLQVIEIIQAPTIADQGQTITVQAKIKNEGTYTDTLKLEAGVVPDYWEGALFSEDFGTQAYSGITKCCAANDYYDAVQITLGPNEEQVVTFSMKTPTIHSVDGCGTDPDRLSAWDDSHAVVVGLYEECGQSYVHKQGQDITIKEISCSSKADCRSNEYCKITGTIGKCAPLTCTNDCLLFDQNFCSGTEVVNCVDTDSDGCYERQTVDICSPSEHCVAGQSSCVATVITTGLKVEESTVPVNVQAGDKITVYLSHTSNEPITLEYDNVFTLDTSTCPSSFTIGTGRTCEFTVDSSAAVGSYNIGLVQGDKQTVNVIDNPQVLILTNKVKLDQRFSSESEVDSLLKETYNYAQDDMVVYDLDDYLTGHPWGDFVGYKESWDEHQMNDNAYALDVASFIDDRCNGCKSTMILGDDFVVPHYRRSLDMSYYGGLVENTEDIYTDVSYIQRTTKPFSEFEDIFYQDEHFDGKNVLIVLPDSVSAELQVEVDRLEQILNSSPNIRADVTQRASSSIECNSHEAFSYYDGWTLVIIGSEKTNRAMNCFPFVIDGELETITLERNPWDGRAYSVIINSDNLDTVKWFNNLIEDGEYKELDSSGWLIARTATNVAAGLAIGAVVVASGGTATPILLMVAAGASIAGDAIDGAECYKWQGSECVEFVVGIALPLGLDKIGKPVLKSAIDAFGPSLRHVAETLGDNTVGFLKRMGKKGQLNPGFGDGFKSLKEHYKYPALLKSHFKTEIDLELGTLGSQKALANIPSGKLADFVPGLSEYELSRLLKAIGQRHLDYGDEVVQPISKTLAEYGRKADLGSIITELKKVPGKRLGDIVPPNVIEPIPIHKITYGHGIDDVHIVISRAHHQHQLDPIEVFKIGDEYVISDGRGRVTRAIWKGEEQANAEVLNTYINLQDLQDKANILQEPDAIADLFHFNNRVEKIDIEETMRLLER